jgi:hypothetical protein
MDFCEGFANMQIRTAFVSNLQPSINSIFITVGLNDSNLNDSIRSETPFPYAVSKYKKDEFRVMENRTGTVSASEFVALE